MPNIGGIAAGAVRKVSDAFTRTNTGPLGTPTGGTQKVWSTAVGTWYANGTSAQSDTAASTYANSYQLLYPNATISADVSGGVGLSFWASSAYPIFYYASFPKYVQNSSTSSSCTGTTVSCSDTSNSCTPTGGCGTVSSNGGVTTCTGGTATCTDTVTGCKPTNWCGAVVSSSTNTTNCATGFFQPPMLSNGYVSGCYSAPSGGSYITSAYTTYSNTYNTNVTTYTRTQNTTVSSTTYTYDTQITTITSAAGSVVATTTTTLVSSSSSLSTVGSLKVVTAGTSATITAYSLAGLSGVLGSPVTFTPGGTPTGPYVGIIKAPSSYNQGSTLDNFSATA
jgi:hypothetical protein